jgi:hypothetical protein
VTLDEKLNFGQLIQNIEKKAGNSLGMLREIKELGQMKTKLLLQRTGSYKGLYYNDTYVLYNEKNDFHCFSLPDIVEPL